MVTGPFDTSRCRAQVGSARETSPTPFSAFVPNDVVLFASTTRLADLDSALGRTRAWQAFPPNSISSASTRLSWLFEVLLNSPIDLPMDDLAACDFALAAPGVTRLNQGVWFLRPADPTQIDRWFPPDQRLAARKNGPATAFTTPRGNFVCLQGSLVALAHRGTDRVLWRGVRMLLAGADRQKSLGRHEPYREFVTHMPARELAFVYINTPDSKSTGVPRRAPYASLLPNLPRSIFGVYEKEGRLDVTFRAETENRPPRPLMNRETMDVLLRTPHTCILAVAGTVDISAWFQRIRNDPPESPIRRYLTLLSGLRGTTTDLEEPLRQCGPDVILLWNLADDRTGPLPELALMVRCVDPRLPRAEITTMARNLVSLLAGTAVSPEAGPVLRMREHLGTPIIHVPLGAVSHRSTSPLLCLLSNADPAWAVWGRWLIISLESVLIDEIIDAQTGLIPSIGSSPGIVELTRLTSDRTSFAVVRPALISEVLRTWANDADRGDPSLLDPNWWSGDALIERTAEESAVVLGLEVAALPGLVEILHDHQRIVGLEPLQPGDQIIAVDHRVLDLNDPVTDFRTRLMSATSVQALARLSRDGTWLDLPINRDPEQVRLAANVVRLAKMARDLVQMGDALPQIAISLSAARPNRISARLTMEFETQTATPPHAKGATGD